MDSYLFYTTYSKPIAGQEFSVEIQKKSCLKQKPNKNKTETIKSRNGWLMYKKILNLLKLSLMKRVNRVLMKKNGEKIMRLKTQDPNLYKSLSLKNF